MGPSSAEAQPKPDAKPQPAKPDAKGQQGKPADKKKPEAPKSDITKPDAKPEGAGAPTLAARGKPAMAHIAESLARDLAQAAPRAVVVAGPPITDTPAPRARELAVALAAQLAGKRGAGSRAHPEALTLASARGAPRGEPALVWLRVEIAGGVLRVSADVFAVPGTVWARLRDPEPAPTAHAFAQAPLDAEVRSFLPPVPLTAFAPVRAKNFEGDVVALACGDIDEDGAPEIVSVSRRRVTTLRLRAARVLPLLSRSWPDLAGVHPSPLREPIALASVVDAAGPDGGALIDVGLSDRAQSVRLDGALRVVGAFAGMAVPDGDASACTRLPALTVTGPLAACTPGDPAPIAASIGGQYDAFASARLVSPRGESFRVWAGRERGVVELRDDAGHRQTIDGAGAQLAVGDLDQDGEPEVLSSLDVLEPRQDAVVVRSWTRGKAGAPSPRPREVARLPAAAGVQALAVCPPDGPGRAAFVVATADEIWVVR